MNDQLIDTVVSPSAPKQVKDIGNDLLALDKIMIDTAKSANILTNAILGSKSFSDYNAKATAAAAATARLEAAQNKAKIAATNLEKAQSALTAQEARTEGAIARQQAAQDRATASAEKALSPYQQLSKRLEELRAQAKNVGATFGETSEQFLKAAKPVQELDAKLKTIDKTLGQSQRNVGNYADGFKGLIAQFVPFGSQITSVVDGIAKTGTAATGATAELGAMAGVMSGVLILGISAATYYLSQFQSTANSMSIAAAGLKNSFADLGKTLLGGIGNGNGKSIGNDFVDNFAGIASALSGAPPKKSDATQRGQAAQAAQIALQNQAQLTQVNDASLKAQSGYFRTLADDRLTDYKDRKKYVDLAVGLEEQALKNQKALAQQTIQTAIQVGFQTTSLTKSQQDAQRKVLTDAANAKGSNGQLQPNLSPAQSLSLNGQQFSAAGFALYQQGIQQMLEFQSSTNTHIQQLNADRDNMTLRADRALAQAQNALDKARIESVQGVAKTTLESTTASNSAKLAANRDYVTQSIALINLEKKNQLDVAGLGSTRGGKDSRTEAITRQSIEQDAQNKITAVQNEGQKTRQDLRKKYNDAVEREQKAKIDGEKQSEQLILENELSTYEQRVKAANDFQTTSLKEIEQQRKQQLSAANLPSNSRRDDPTQKATRTAINQEAENQSNTIKIATEKTLSDIGKSVSSALKKQYDDIVAGNKAISESTLAFLQDALENNVQFIQSTRDKEVEILDERYAKGKIDRKQYNDDLLKIDDTYNIQRLSKELQYQQSELFVRQRKLASDIAFARDNGASDDDVAKITADSGIKQNKTQIATTQSNLNNALKKKNTDDTQSNLDAAQKVKEDTASAIQDAQQLEANGVKLINGQYEHQIELLEQRSKIIDEQAAKEKFAIQNSLLTEKQKAQQEQLLDAQTASSKEVIAKQEAALKEKEAKYDRALAVANIIQNTAVGATKATGTVFGISLVPIIIALGAAELATVLATPLPTFAKGGVTPGGAVLWGEAGMESAKLPDGSVQVSKGPTIQSFPKGTVITPHMDLMRQIRPDKVNYIGGEQVPWREVIEAIERNKPQRESKRAIHISVNGDFDRYKRNRFR